MRHDQDYVESPFRISASSDACTVWKVLVERRRRLVEPAALLR